MLGRARSTAEISSLSDFELALALRSEQTASGASGTSASVDHSRSVCDSKLIDGTRKRTLRPVPTSCSARRSEVNVLPVPQAMMSLAAVVCSQPLGDARDSILLVRAEVLRRDDGQVLEPRPVELLPIYGRRFEVGEPDPPHGDLLTLDRVLGVRVPLVGG